MLINQRSKSTIAIIHLFMGWLFIFDVFSKIYSVGILVVGIYYIVQTKNSKNKAAFFAAYMVGIEVLFRMSGKTFFYEFSKYTVLIFLAIGLYVEQKKHHVSISYLMYILLLLIGIVFVDIPFNESVHKAVAFNLSGPVLLGVSAIYFYNRKMKLTEVLDLLYVMVLPIISMLGYLFLKTPNLKQIVFNSTANFQTSGGFGPNQVSTVLGLGIFIFFVHLVLRKRIFSLLIVDVLFFMYLIYRGLLTFSRGGMLTAFLAIVAFSYFYLLSAKDGMKEFVKYSLLIMIAGISLWTYTVYQTGGMLANRYANRNTQGVEKKDFTTGRGKIFIAELDAYFENPFFGLGVGGSKFYRANKLNKTLASHNEVGRLLSEHGMIGVLILMILIAVPSKHILAQPFLARGLLSAFLILWFLTIAHSAMRVAFPSFIYGLSVIRILMPGEKEFDEVKKEES